MNTYRGTLWGILLHVIIFYSVAFAQEEDLLDNRCEEDQFFKPYIQIRSKKVSGPVVDTYETAGIFDLRKHSRSFICINGAVIAYTRIITTALNGTRGKGGGGGPDDVSMFQHTVKVPDGKKIQFTDGTLKLFNHTCLPVNWLDKSREPMIGMKAAGIFLLYPENATESNIKPPPLKYILNKKDLDYRIGVTENEMWDTSFVAAGPGPHCIAVTIGKSNSTLILQSNAKDEFDICHWSLSHLERADKVYRQFFRRGLKRKDYKWVECPSNYEQLATEGNLATYKHPRRDGKKVKKVEYIDSGSYEHNKLAKDHKQEGGEAPKNYLIDLEDCETYPKFDKNHPECTFMTETGRSCENFEMLNIALELESSKDSPPPKQPTLMEMEGLRWKHDVMSLVASIFAKVCLPIRKQSAFHVIRLIGMYLVKAHTSKAENSTDFSKVADKSEQWEGTISYLLRCDQDNGTKAMGWDWGQVTVEPLNVPTTQATAAAGASPAAGPASKGAAKGRSMAGMAPAEPEPPAPVQSQAKPASGSDDRDWETSKKNFVGASHRLRDSAKTRWVEPLKSKYGRGRETWNRRELIAPLSGFNNLLQDDAKPPKTHRKPPAPAKAPPAKGRKKRNLRNTDNMKPEATPIGNSWSNFEIKLFDFFNDHHNKRRIQRSASKPINLTLRYAVDDFLPGSIPRWRREEGEENKLPLPFIQEYIPPAPSSKEMTHEDFVYFPDHDKVRIKGKSEKQIFFYRELGELPYDLNPIIDAFWKILSVVLGYCQKYESSKGHGIFSNAFQNFNEYFLNLLKEEWMQPEPTTVNQLLMVAGEFLDEDRNYWLDTCLESAYILSDSVHLRPNRPLEVEVIENTEQGLGDAKIKGNDYFRTPEDEKDGTTKYFVAKHKRAQIIH